MYKTFDPTQDIAYSEREVYMYNPISGSVFQSASIGANAKTWWRFYPNQIKSGSTSGSFFCTVYDRVATSAEAVELFDATFGISSASTYYHTGTFVYAQKNQMYKLYADLCWGNSNHRWSVNSTYYDELFFVHFKRNLIHDEIRKGYNVLYTVFADKEFTGSGYKYTITDATAKTSWYEDEGGTWQYMTGPSGTAGWVFYDLGVMALIPTGSWGFSPYYHGFSGSLNSGTGDGALYRDVAGSFSSAIAVNTIDNLCAFALEKMDVANYTHPMLVYAEQTMHSAIYFCHLNAKDFNYSSNPTYVDSEGKILMTSGSRPTKPCTYITTVGLYGPSNELLGTAKISEPLKKAADKANVVSVRLNY